ncbi:ATP-dependent RNA helicase NAM7 [Ascoidea rubescens DSM 1968]|uniref:ATP-dependent helicase NAM7 n=1 Tax=Ascoidea rubescens DSM 1968 TaxID=1344418 RepID=A0A1D2VKW5_9ASCO|nr:ATP-dependent helicase NAM7 [Ascoidea rubescens DSM 1968]ODV62253.1 ATP-dependent helicase NAM7 [Ascoidea rubescens DSM 1968]
MNTGQNILFNNTSSKPDDDSDNESINSNFISSTLDEAESIDKYNTHPEKSQEDNNNIGFDEIIDDIEGSFDENQYTFQELPEHACSYCGIHSPSCVVKCESCNKWFCNSKQNTSGSHIITHLVISHHNTVSLHADCDLGDTTLECYNCGSKNIFILGYVSAKSESVVVILCRLPCAQSKDVNWDTEQWQPLIDNRQLLSWIAALPSEEEQLHARLITPSQITKLEAQWRMNKNATLEDIEKNTNEEDEILPILMRYKDAYEYQRSFGPLVKLEADYDKHLKESQGLEHISVKWSLGLNNRHLASFTLSTFETNELKVAVGDEMVLRYSGTEHDPWECNGYIVKLPSSYQEEFTLELCLQRTSPPVNLTNGFTADFVWKGTSYERMQTAMKIFAVDKESVSGYIYHKLLGHDVPEIEFDVKLPPKFSLPQLTDLNISQANAVRSVLQKPLSLIQGPPGTGKTVTSATIVYHLSKINKERILVCAPSNVAVDHLASKLSFLGLKIIRLTAKSREDVESSVSHLSLHSLVKTNLKGELKKLMKLKEEVGELSSNDSKKYLKLIRKAENKLLSGCDVVCCTCVGAGDKRLQNSKFRTVLIDESTQASEPECLIPIVKGAKQVILVGDHQQLGPVILDKNAGDAGLKQSLFERLVLLGHIPIRLEVQYRMNPFLSDFPSNMFYEGSLQNGVTTEDRLIPDSTFPWPIFSIPMMFWANYGREEISASGTSYLNRVETINVEKIVTKLFNDGIKPSQIGIITPYEGQRAYITQYMTHNGSLSNELYMNVEVASVDAFQGREKDFIILSCVRANEGKVIGFLSDPRRLNVALTRAKYGLIILGNPRSLARNSLWNNLLTHFREKGCLVEGPLDNLQLCTIQLSNRSDPNYQPYRPNHSDNFVGSTVKSSVSNDFDTSSLVSFMADSFNSLGTFGAFNQQPGWPPLGGERFNSRSGLGSANPPSKYYNSSMGISSFTEKLNQLNSGQDAKYSQSKQIEDDIASLSSNFVSKANLH